MPGLVIFHQSTFDVYGYVCPVTSESIVNPRSSIVPAVGQGAINSSVSVSSNLTPIPGKVIHSSLFNILIERSIHIESVVIPQLSNNFANHIPLSINSIVECIGHFIFSSNATLIQTIGYPVSNITVVNTIPNDRSIWFGPVTFAVAKRNSEDKITPILDSKVAETGINEPKAYSRVISIKAETMDRTEHDTLIDLVGSRYVLSVYGIAFPNTYITNISDIQLLPCLCRFGYTIEFTTHVLPQDNNVVYGGVTLSHASRSAPDDIAPSYLGAVGSGFSLTNLVPKITRTWTFDCVTTNISEYTGLISLFGLKCNFTLNNESFTGVYISKLSKLTPKGNNSLFIYNVEFQQESGDDPVPVTFDSISIPNCTDNSSSNIEILSNRTTLQSGKIAVDIGSIPARAVSFSCMDNSRVVYDALYNLIGTKASLTVDTVTISKAYISSLSSVQKKGSASNPLYVWTIGFEEETV
jgi:hypothetical protein